MSSDSKIHIACPVCLAANRLANSRLNDNPKCGKCGEYLFSGSPVNLDDKSFAKFIKYTDVPIVVDFWASWCGPCKVMAPVFKQAAEKLEPGIRFAKVNTEVATITSAQFNIRNIPIVVLLKKGVNIAQVSGAMSLSQLTNWINHKTNSTKY